MIDKVEKEGGEEEEKESESNITDLPDVEEVVRDIEVKDDENIFVLDKDMKLN